MTTEKSRDCRCGHPRYGHPTEGEMFVKACASCWADASNEDGYLDWRLWLSRRVSDHDFEEAPVEGGD